MDRNAESTASFVYACWCAPRWLLLWGLLVLPVPGEAASLAVVVTSSEVLVGEQVRVDLQISGLGDSAEPSLGTFDLTLAFDPLVLDPVSVQFGDGLDVLGLGSVRDFSLVPGGGMLNLFEVSLDAPDDLNSLQAGNFRLGSIVFSAVGMGTSALSLTVNALGDALGAPLDFDVTNASVVVRPVSHPVPEPSLIGLLVAGGSLVGALAQRRRARLVEAPRDPRSLVLESSHDTI